MPIADTRASATPFANGAAELAAQGFPVFRITPGQKTGGARWVHGPASEVATIDPEEIARRVRRFPTSNIGIATGNGLVVLDIDTDAGGVRPDWAIPTREARTPSGGLHLYYRTHGHVKTSAGELGIGIDVRGDGGMVLAPPSAIGAGRYAWITDPQAPMAVLPADRFIGDRHRIGAPGAHQGRGRKRPEDVRLGEIHNTLLSWAGWLAWEGFTEEQASAFLRLFIERIPAVLDMEDTEDDIEKCVAWVYAQEVTPGDGDLDVDDSLVAELCEDVRPQLTVVPEPEPETPAEIVGLPDYPRDIFTGAAGQQFDEICRGGLPAAFAGGALLSTAATVIGSSALVELDGAHQYAGLWIPLLGPVSGGKTPPWEIATSPIWSINAEHAGRYQEELADWLALSSDERRHEPRPWRFSLTVQDFTFESLARTLDKQQGSVGILVDELAGPLQGLGQYKNGVSSDNGRLLSLWSQQPWDYTRVGSGGGGNGVSIYIPKPVVTICGTLQFDRADLLGTGGDGLRARWLLHAANPVPAAGQPNAHTLRVWRDCIEELHEARWSEVVTDRHWTLTDEAARRFYEQRIVWSTRSRELGQCPEGGALGKADTHALRVALVLAELEQPGANRARISLDTLERAIAVVNFSAACWADQDETEALSLTWKDDRLNKAVVKMRAWLRGRGWVSERDLKRAKVAGARTASQQAELFDYYRETYPDLYKNGCYRA